MSSPLTAQQLDEIETRAAHLTEYATLHDQPLQADADRLTGGDVPALLDEVRRLTAESEHLRKERDAFRDQRNGVFKTNRRLLAEMQEADQARLRAENETRTLKRDMAALKTRATELEQDSALLGALHAAGVDNWDGYDDAREHLPA